MSLFPLVFFDLETSGLDPERHEVIQLAAVAVGEGWRELDAMEVKVEFDPAGADAAALTGNCYDPEVWAREAIPPDRARFRFEAFLRPHRSVEKVSKAGNAYRVARLCGHNAAAFDAPFLLSWFRRSNLFLPAAAYEALDTLALARWATLACSDPPENCKLGTLCGWLGVELERAHDALADVRATVEVARRLLGRLSGASVNVGS